MEEGGTNTELKNIILKKIIIGHLGQGGLRPFRSIPVVSTMFLTSHLIAQMIGFSNLISCDQKEKYTISWCDQSLRPQRPVFHCGKSSIQEVFRVI